MSTGAENAGTDRRVAVPRRPNLRGDLDSVLDFEPCFRGAVRGYDRGQVDSYVAWAERELRAARRSADELAARFGGCSAELERTRRQLARSEDGRDVLRVSDRMAQVLELAADEAAELVASGAAEADQVVDRARTYATAMLGRAREAEDAAAAHRQAAAEAREESAALLERASAEAAELRAAAVAQCQRLDAEAAQQRDRLDRESAARRAQAEEQARQQLHKEAAAAALQIAAAQREVDALLARRDCAQRSLQVLTEQVGEALAALASSLPAEPAVTGTPQPVR